MGVHLCRRAHHHRRYLSKCTFQYSSQTTSVWYLKKDQYKPCPSIQAPEKKNSIIVLLRLAGEEVKLDLNCLKPDRARTVPTLSSFPNSLTRTAHPALSLRSPEPCCSGSSIFDRLQASPATVELASYDLGWKCTCSCNSTETGWPFREVGSYFHCCTALNAAAISSGCPLTTCAWTTFPRSSITASITTVPEMRVWRASGGYSGSMEYV